MLLAAGALSVVTYLDKTTPNILLLMTFILGAVSAFIAPTWQAVIPELVPNKDLEKAISLDSAGVNVAAAIGPALAGVIIAATNTAIVFAINALSFLAIVIALLYWQRKPIEETTLPAERFFAAMRLAIRHIRAAPILHHIFIRTAALCLFASASWSLIPIYAKNELNSGALGYGVLLTTLGVGAIIATIALPFLRKRLSANQTVDVAFLTLAAGTALLALVKIFSMAGIAMFLIGFAWIIALTELTTATQEAVPFWLKGRVLALFLMVSFGGIALGSMLWGAVTFNYSISSVLLIASGGLLFSGFITRFLNITPHHPFNHTPSHHLPAPAVKLGCRETSPVMVNIEYFVHDDKTEEFTKIMQKAKKMRIRQGAFFWKLYLDTENQQRFIECFLSENWIDHLRIHERLSVSDQELDLKIREFHHKETAPNIVHLVEVRVK